jgi:hypothetical protein
MFHPSAFAYLVWVAQISSAKAFIVFQLGLHIDLDGPHTPCSHAKKLKNVARG